MAVSLERGLRLLEILAEADGPLSFGELTAALGQMNPASLSRLLKDLAEWGYVLKDPQTGRYLCGRRLSVFSSLRVPERGEELKARYIPLMLEITGQYDVTTILQERVNDALVCIHREQTDASVRMQQLGYVAHRAEDLWWQLLASREPRLQALVTADADQAQVRQFAEWGYAYDTDVIRPDFRRLAFPILSSGGTMIGALGIGGTHHQLPETTLPEIIKAIVKKLSL